MALMTFRTKNKLRMAFKKSFMMMVSSAPMLMAVMMIFGLVSTFSRSSSISTYFTGSPFTDSIVGSMIGSVLAGNPIESYVIGGELLKQGISIGAVTAFLISWVTVGALAFPLEVAALGKRFTIIRNIGAFVLAIIIGIVVQWSGVGV